MLVQFAMFKQLYNCSADANMRGEKLMRNKLTAHPLDPDCKNLSHMRTQTPGKERQEIPRQLFACTHFEFNTYQRHFVCDVSREELNECIRILNYYYTSIKLMAVFLASVRCSF